jgi:hypothetical protein
METEYEAALNALGASANDLVIIQHFSGAPLQPEYGRLRRYRVLKQGHNSLSFYRAASN